MPQLPGGGDSQAIVAAIQKQVVYPKLATTERRSGRVFATFIVTEQGDVQAIRIVKGLGAAYDAAVMEAIQKLPKFEPGKHGGKAVSVSFTVPVMFVWIESVKSSKVLSFNWSGWKVPSFGSGC